ncbi:MAG TPA: Ig domain-containing protein [Candidatus Acidoferrum sp.]|nr:Ig domain-containing protein [Candidatus Acidoferrum sp.]
MPPPPPQITLAVATSTLPKAVTGSPYTTRLQATGGTPPYTWSLALFPGQTAASVLPAGLAFASDGTLSGTAATGCYSIWTPQFVVTDAAAQSAGVGLELDCVAPLTFSSNVLGDGNIALPYSGLFNTQGGDPPIQFALTSGSLPPGLKIDTTQTLQGTPSSPGKYTFTIQASDSKTPTLTASQTFTLTIDNNLVLPNSSLPGAVQNIPYLEQIQPAGGTPPYHFVLGQFSSLPPGLTLDSATGKVSGTPTTQTSDTMLVTITDSAPTPVTINPLITLNVAQPLAFQTTSLPDGILNLLYGTNIGIVGGRGPYTLSLASGTLPDGISIFNFPSQYSFGLSGTAQKDGTFPFTLKITDSYETPNTATKSFQIRVGDQIAITGPGSVQLLFNQSYTGNFPVTGGIPPYTWTMETVPPGFTFDATTGNLSGTGIGGTFAHPNVTVQDSSNPPQSATYFSFVLDVYTKLVIKTSSLPPISVGGTTYLGLVTSSTATPYTWTITSGSLPPGLDLVTTNDMALFKGTPTAAGTYPFTIHLVDGNTGNLQQSVSAALTLVVKDPGQMVRNDSPATATPVSNINLLASISPFTDPQSAGADADFYAASAVPGSIVQIYTSPNNDFLQPPEPNSLQPVLEIVDATGQRYQTCAPAQPLPTQMYNFPCVNNLPGSNFLQGNFYSFQVPGSGTTPVTFYVRVSDARGDARPDFIYTLSIYGVN